MSKALGVIKQAGWSYKESGNDQIQADCPLCRSIGKFYLNVGGEEKDGLWSCKKCGESGNLYQLRERSGISTSNNVVSMQDTIRTQQAPDPIPDFNSAHRALANNESETDVLDYLVADRGLSMRVIEDYKIGVEHGRDGAKWIVYPYLDVNGVCTFVKYRSLPPAKKEFRTLRGRENPLFNGKALQPGLQELFVVEGEIDCLTLLSQGITAVVGVPGANMKKSVWIDRMDEVRPEVIYLVYDTDKVGQAAAKEMAQKIGIDRVHNILLPAFETVDGRLGKDVNEWFRAGHTVDEFNDLKLEAKPFDVAGVQSISDVLQELHAQFTEVGNQPTILTQWPSLNKRVGGFEFGDLVGLMAEAKVGKTSLAMNLCDFFAMQGLGSFLYCNEMKPVRMVRKWVAYKTQTNDGELTPQHVEDAMSLVQTYKGDLLFGYTKMGSKPIDDVIATIRQAVRRYGLKVVCFDNLHLLVRSVEHSVQEISNMTKRFKDLAMELNILFILILQPRRVAKGSIISAQDANGSSAIEKDVDCMICLHRNRVGEVKQSEFDGILETEENFQPFMLVRADLTRYAAGGATTLFIDGAKSTIREMLGSDVDRPSPVFSPTGGIPVAA